MANQSDEEAKYFLTTRQEHCDEPGIRLTHHLKRKYKQNQKKCETKGFFLVNYSFN
jgi:hypothetical protein